MINIPYLEKAGKKEKRMHRFLEACGIFQINVKAQLQEDNRSSYQASPKLAQLSVAKNSGSPSLMQRRQARLESLKQTGSTEASFGSGSNSAKADPVRMNIGQCTGFGKVELFGAGQGFGAQHQAALSTNDASAGTPGENDTRETKDNTLSDFTAQQPSLGKKASFSNMQADDFPSSDICSNKDDSMNGETFMRQTSGPSEGLPALSTNSHSAIDPFVGRVADM